MTTNDEQIGRNLASMRGDMSQKDLADEMRKRGFKWSQATVWSIEKGERPLRLAEAESVADIVVRPLDVLLARDGEASVHAATRVVNGRYKKILEAMESYDEGRAHLAMALDAIPDSEKSGLLRVATDWVTATVDQALEDYRNSSESEFAAMLARYAITQDQYDATNRRDEWLDRYNSAQRRFREGRVNERQATP